jgi:hypothetical protein
MQNSTLGRIAAQVDTPELVSANLGDLRDSLRSTVCFAGLGLTKCLESLTGVSRCGRVGDS